MARQPIKTPGAKEAPKAEVKATTTVQASTDDALDAVLGKPETKKTAEDALAEILSGEDPVEADAVEHPEGFVPTEQLDAVAAELEATKKALALVTQSQAKTVKATVAPQTVVSIEGKPKRKRTVCHPQKGWMVVED